MDIIGIINNVCDVIIENKDYLTDLDREIGDGDHGVNLARGFGKIKEQIDTFKSLKPNEIFNKIAMVLISNVGGASGALYGSAFLKASSFLKQIDNKVDGSQIAEIFNQMIEAIKTRGNSQVCEKTMLDTLVPAQQAFKKAIDENKDLIECFKEMDAKAFEGKESTKNIIATRGRASYLKDRSIGSLDPGSVSSYLIINTIYKSLSGE